MHSVHGSDGLALHFPTKKEYEQYKKEERAFNLAWLEKLNRTHGIYAVNQSKYVSKLSDLNSLELDLQKRSKYPQKEY
jgi:hypothetical protein